MSAATTQPFRLATGGRVDRTQPLAFTFNGRRVKGYAGDTVASALLANGVRLVGRSFKYHRPRGVPMARTSRTRCSRSTAAPAASIPTTARR